MYKISKERNKIYARRRREKQKLILKQIKLKIHEFTIKNDEIVKEILKLKKYISEEKKSNTTNYITMPDKNINDIMKIYDTSINDISNFNTNWEYR